MSKFSDLSMFQKMAMSAAPLIVGVCLVSWLIESISAGKDEDLTRAVAVVNATNAAELAMTKMSEHMRGYLLNPDNKSEKEKKLKQDEEYSVQTKIIADTASDSKEIEELNKAMAEFDESTLDKEENKVLSMVDAHDPSAVKYYYENYLPAREKQTANFQNLKTLVNKYSDAAILKSQTDKRNNGHLSIALVLGCTLLSLIIMVFVTKSVVTKVRTIGQLLQTYAEKIGSVTHQLENTAGSLAAANTEQASSVIETVASLEEISAMVARSADSAQSSSQCALNTQNKAHEGKSVVADMLQSMEEINESNQSIVLQMGESNTQFLEIVRIIQEIETKTKVINDIVFQTKLLSFNASVEAARAGEHGKGFSVVAEEVGNLAQMSGNAAKEISELLNTSIQKVDEIVKESKAKIESIVKVGREKVESGKATADRCASVLNEIAGNVDQVSEMAKEISSASAEQASGVGEINKAMNALDQVTQSNAKLSQETSNSTQELGGQVALLNKTSLDLILTIDGYRASLRNELNFNEEVAVQAAFSA